MVWAHRHAALLLLRALGLPCLRDHLLRLAPHVLHVAGEVGLLDGVGLTVALENATHHEEALGPLLPHAGLAA